MDTLDYTGQRQLAAPDDANLGHIHPELAMQLTKKIWSAGLQLSALQALLREGPLSDKAAAVVEELDTVIRDIRAGVSG